jgi:hypothetical protein
MIDRDAVPLVLRDFLWSEVWWITVIKTMGHVELTNVLYWHGRSRCVTWGLLNPRQSVVNGRKASWVDAEVTAS